ncbi:uncharacterized protein PITG_15262 [Phytophthora infestans T30-4]|uniref:Uncharacterized protein n=1 Tax=Phytophthora infestans (strain T30-4) TaxID=403677 RepID=D0NQA3_PHYIT|nr:uncharacterized protein PITG_15262 [Phytophthora infestans T30-4]EEY62835.1 conserved hypothetical protein [Phytophthora infestans T30-4]|eukprot:XP_002898710.1 conserved hypothetical protein [Phytophthora infestans T30-4]
MALLHALCSTFLICSAKLYWLLENDYIDYFAGLLAPERDRHFRVVGTVLGMLGAIHGLQLLCHVRASAAAGEIRHYTRMFALRKTVEIATQAPNGYLHSTLVARSWINHAKVALIVTNCWSAFIIHQMLLKSDPGIRQVAPSSPRSRISVRFLAVTVDAVLATATAIILPGAIFLPYALQFDITSLSFPVTLLYGDTSFPNLVLENRAFFFMSWTNSMMKTVPHLSVFLCLEAMASILSRVHRVTVPMLLLITGGIVLGLHLTAQYGSVTEDIATMESMCIQRMHPWFASNFSCSVVRYNCYKEGVTSPSEEVLGWLEREAVRKIIFMHCSAFTMPPIIREFSSLMGDAAVSADLHPMMLFALFIYVNLTGIPSGLLQAPLPIQLTDLEFIHTNLTTISDSVVEPWNGLEILFIEHSKIRTFPSVLMQLPLLSDLSLIDNEIETIPDDAFLNEASTYFYSFDISYLALEFTQLIELPNKNTMKLSGDILCGEDENAWDPLGDERYPIKLVEPFRSLDA